jgi:hypothetical protein
MLDKYENQGSFYISKFMETRTGKLKEEILQSIAN